MDDVGHTAVTPGFCDRDGLGSVVSCDVGIVYSLYASSQPESAGPCTRRTRTAFAIVIALLVLLPMGTVAEVSPEKPVQARVQYDPEAGVS